MTGQNITFYTSAYCPFAARGAIAFEETQHPKESVEIDLSAPRPEWYLKEINPYGQVPALKINGEHIVLESLFVAEYLADLHPESGLLPKDALQRAQLRYLIHTYGTHIHPAHHKATYTSDPEETVKHRAALLVELEKFEKLLTNAKVIEEGPYFLGKDFTLADLAIAPFLVRFFLIDAYHRVEGAPEFLESKEVKEKLPRFLAWKAAVVERESVKKTTPDLEYIKEMYKKFIK